MPAKATFQPVVVPYLSDIPVLGPAFFSENVLVYALSSAWMGQPRLPERLLAVLDRADNEGIPTNSVADAMARQIIAEARRGVA